MYTNVALQYCVFIVFSKFIVNSYGSLDSNVISSISGIIVLNSNGSKK